MAHFHNTALIGASGAGSDAFKIDRSLRFNSDDSAYLNRTPSSQGNNKTWTFSFWIKRCKIGSRQAIFTAGADGAEIIFNGADNLRFYYYQGGVGYRGDAKTQAVFRDTSAWMHAVVVYNSTESTGSDRIKIYVNGVQQALTHVHTFPQNTGTDINNSSTAHYIGKYSAGNSQFGQFYLAEVHHVDGTALAPTDFGETDNNNNWIAKEYAGSHGTNGFHLDFKDTSDLGADAAGSNNWTSNNLSGTAPGFSTADQGFGILTYTGNQTARNISGLSFAPDLVIIKSRSDSGYNHYWVDRVRGTDKNLYSNSTEATQVAARLSSFNSDGIGLTNHMGVNKTSSNFVAWCWKAGGSASSNSNGTITSSVSANNTYGFSIVAYTGNNTSGATVGHGLNSAPKFVIIKSRDQNGQYWHVYHASLAANEYIYLNDTNAKTSGNDFMNGTRPSSSVLTLGNGNACNKSGDDVIAYCWSEVAGFSKFGSWTGNGSSTGPKITTGFKPHFLLWKRTDGTANWYIYDTARQSGNPLNKNLEPNTGDAENTLTSMNIDFLSDGFQLKGTDGDINANNGNYIYAAFATKPDESIIDSLVDTPTNYEASSGNNGGNYATLNPLANLKFQGRSLADGNLDFTGTRPESSGYPQAFSTIGMSSGKFYCEATVMDCTDTNGVYVGVCDKQMITTEVSVANTYPGGPGGSAYGAHGKMEKNSSVISTGNGTYTGGDIIGIAYDADSGKLYFSKNGTFVNSANPAGGTNPNLSGITGEQFFVFGGYGPRGLIVNFGQRPFNSTPPSGFKSLCTTNLTDPTIADGSTAFDTTLYSGNGSNGRAITGLNFSPDLVWIKARNQNDGHNLFDIVRGTTKVIKSNNSNAELTESNSLTAFNSDGFTVGDNSSNAQVNASGFTYVAWTWDGGSSTSSNSDGSITSSVRANPSTGFSIVSWSGHGSGSATVGHGLNAAPELIILKGRTNVGAWVVGSDYIGWGNRLELNTTSASSAASADFNSTAPTSSVFTVGSNQGSGNKIAYCFTPVAGYSAFGTYTGNGSSDGPFVHTGFRVAWLLTKRTDGGANNWQLIDAARSPFNVADDVIKPDESSAETTHADYSVDFLSNGFKHRTGHIARNGSGNTYFYAAFAEHPFKTARAR